MVENLCGNTVVAIRRMFVATLAFVILFSILIDGTLHRHSTPHYFHNKYSSAKHSDHLNSYPSVANADFDTIPICGESDVYLDSIGTWVDKLAFSSNNDTIIKRHFM